MILTIICGLSICSLCGFSTTTTVIFTTLFSIGVFALFIRLKLKLALDEDEVRAIRGYIRRARELKRRVGRFLAPIRERAAKLGPILEKM